MRIVFNNLATGCDEVSNNANKQCAQKKVALGRISDPLNQTHLDICRQKCLQVLAVSDVPLSSQLLVGPLLPQTLAAKDTNGDFQPAFFAAGALHEATHHEPHLFGSIRVCFTGSKTFAAVDVGCWLTFVRQKPGGEDKGKAARGEISQGSGEQWVPLASVNTEVTPLVARRRFRIFTHDNHHFVLLSLLNCIVVVISVWVMLLTNFAQNHLTKDDATAFLSSSPKARIWAGTIQEGESLSLPPGFLFTDLIGATGSSGLKLTWIHRASAQTLKQFSDQTTLFQTLDK